MPDPRANRLLAALPEADWLRWAPKLERAVMPLGTVLYESGGHLSHAYFPTQGIVSLLYVTESGFEEFENVRTRVGRNMPLAQKLWLVDVLTQRVRELDFSALPGIATDPLADLRKAAGQEPFKGERAVRIGDWKLQVSERPKKVWLYNLATDPTEKTNLAASMPDRVASQSFQRGHQLSLWNVAAAFQSSGAPVRGASLM